MLNCEGAVQDAVSSLRAEMLDAAASVAAFSKILRSHTALTQDTGQMLEEVKDTSQGRFLNFYCTYNVRSADEIFV